MNAPRPMVLYHAECNDGIAAAWCVSQVLPDAEFIAVVHKQPPPDVRGRDVIIVDFSYPRDVLLEMLDACASLSIYDHHDTAEKALSGLQHPNLLRVVFDMERSGAGLAWDEVVNARAQFPSQRRPRPKLIDLVEDGDLWRFKHGDLTKNVVEAVRATPRNIQKFGKLVDMADDPMLLGTLNFIGEGLRQYKQQMGEQAIHFAQDITLAGHHARATNVPYFLSSEVANALITDDGDLGVTYYWDGRTGEYALSLRSRNGTAAKVALELGGGGHPNAAGVRVKKLPWAVQA